MTHEDQQKLKDCEELYGFMDRYRRVYNALAECYDWLEQPADPWMQSRDQAPLESTMCV